MARSHSIGDGPPCPVAPARHGSTYDYRSKTRVKGHDFWCGHSEHGGNGKFFTYEEVHGKYEIQEGDVTLLLETAAREVIAGATTLDKATQDVSRQTGRSTAQTREALGIMIQSIEEKDQTMADSKAAAAAKQKQRSQKPAPGERHRLERADGERFRAVLEKHGLNNKQAAEATGEAGLGKSSTYIYILLHEGASVDLFDKFEAAVKDWASRNKDVLKEAKKVAAKATRKPAAPRARKRPGTASVAAAINDPFAEDEAPPPADLEVEEVEAVPV